MAKRKEPGTASGWVVCDTDKVQFMDRTYNMTRNVAEAFLYPSKAAAQTAADVKGGIGGKFAAVKVTIRAELGTEQTAEELAESDADIINEAAEAGAAGVADSEYAGQANGAD